MTIPEWTLAETSAAIASRRVASREVVEACLERISRWQPRVNAFTEVFAEQALAAARLADESLASGAPPPPLHGVPLAHKDVFQRRGRAAGMGSRAPLPANGPPSTALARLAAAGAIDLGTLNLAEFALGPTGHNPYTGDCRNPWNPDYIAGGSSSGSGAAIAARMAYGSLGSDTGGSIRLPASATGVLGIKPTCGRVTLAGMMPLAPSVDVPGIVARTALDAALLLRIVAGHDPMDARTSRLPVPDYARALERGVHGLRVGVPENFFGAELDVSVERAIDESRRLLSALGASVVAVRVPAPERLTELSRALVYAEAAAVHGDWLREHAADYSPQVRVRAATGFAIPDSVHREAQRLRPAILRNFVSEVFSRCDVLHLATLGSEVPTLAETDVGSESVMWDRISRLVRCTAPFNYLGLPALSVPCGFTQNGLPVGFQLVGRPFSEATLLNVAHAYQGATDWHRRAATIPDAAHGHD